MQMVSCDKCGKPIDHIHRFQLTPTGAEHLNCNDPIALAERVTKVLPAFVFEAPQKRSV